MKNEVLIHYSGAKFIYCLESINEMAIDERVNFKHYWFYVSNEANIQFMSSFILFNHFHESLKSSDIYLHMSINAYLIVLYVSYLGFVY